MDVAGNKQGALVELARFIHRRSINRSYNFALYSVLGQTATAIFIYLVLKPFNDALELTVWLGLMLLQQVVWTAAVLIWRSSGSRLRYAGRWLFLHGATTYISALLWGLGPGWRFFVTGEPLYQGVIILSLLGVATSTLFLNAMTWVRGALFIVLVVTPLAYSGLEQGGVVYVAISLLIAAYGLLLITLLHYRHTELLSSANLELEHTSLLREQRAYKSYMMLAQEIAKLASWELDLRSGELRFSNEAYRMFDLPLGKQLTKDSLLQVIHQDDRMTYIRALRGSIDNLQSLYRTFRVIRSDGSVHTIRESAEFDYDETGKAQKLYGVMFDETDRVAAEHKTSNLYMELTRVLNNMQDTYYRADPAGRLIQLSNSVFKLLGYTPIECIGWQIDQLFVAPHGGVTFMEEVQRAGGALSNYETVLRHRDGRKIWVSMNGQFIRADRERMVGMEGTIRDVSELRLARQALFQEKEQALVTLESIGDGVITTDRHGRILYLNPTAERLVGMALEKVRGSDYQTVLPVVDEESGKSLGNLVSQCLRYAEDVHRSDEGIMLKEDGSRYHLKITTAPMRNEEQELIGAVLVLHDISEVMGMAKQLSYQAQHDQLTGLYNRSVFEQRTREIIRSALQDGEHHVLLYMDLDQFKVVNDTCGHHAGDELLKQVAMQMHERVRDTDTLARLGGDEFGALLERCPMEMAVEIANTLLSSVREFRFAWEGKAFEIGISIGLVPISRDSGDISHVLAAADAACYVAKDSGRNRLHIYQPDDEAVLQRHGEMQWVHRLSSAFDSDRFVLFAQPIVHLDGERHVSHYEILVRMQDEKGEIIPPGAFIPAAERYNLMPLIDRWVIRNTLQMMRAAQGALAFPPLECAINLSGQSLCDDELLPYVVDLFDETGIPCESISFEVTETAAVANLTRARRFISVLRGMGCSFSLDDFGAGLSSFGYLKSLPVDYLKIDGAFVRDMVIDRVDAAMVRSINEIGHLMGLQTIGEYAEDEMVLLALKQAGVDFAQGVAIASPRPFSEILEMEKKAMLDAGNKVGTPG